MNIFNTLSKGNGTISETNVTSFTSFLLNPYETHGLGILFLIEILKPFIENNNIKYKDLRETKKWINRYIIEIIPEHRVDLPNGKYRDIDIVIKFYDYEKKSIQFTFGIENKIKSYDNGDTKKQLLDEIKGLSEEKTQNIDFIFLTLHPANKEFIKEINNKINDNIKLINLCWKNDKLYKSFSEIIEELLTKEQSGKIQPMYEYIRHTLKSFNQFIETDFNKHINYSGDAWQKTIWSKEDYKKEMGKFKLFENVSYIIDYVNKELKTVFDEKYTPTYISLKSEKVKNNKNISGIFITIKLQKTQIIFGIKKNKDIEWNEYFKKLKKNFDKEYIENNVREGSKEQSNYYECSINNIDQFKEHAFPLIQDSWNYLTDKN